MILTTEQAAKKFGFRNETMLVVFKKKGSPAFRLDPTSQRSPWRVDDEKLEKFLIQESEVCKG